MIDPAQGDSSERVDRTAGPSVASSIPSSLASLQPDNELRVSTLELFFDLVFVLTITQLAAQLSNQPSPTGALRVFLIFVVLFWMYAGYVLLTNQVPPVSITRRLLLIGGMAGFFVCAVAIPRAFIDTGLLIVVLGESVVAVGFGVSDVAMDPRVVSVAVLGLVLSAELWWIYFATDEDQAKLNMRDASVSQRLRMAVFGYFYAFSGVLLGVTVLASGVRLTIGGILDRLPLAPALLLAGGVALFLLGDFLFRKSLQIAAGQSRFVAAAVALLTVPLGMYGAGIAEMIGLIATLAVMLLFEPRRVA